jgi:hypothetical protein
MKKIEHLWVQGKEDLDLDANWDLTTMPEGTYTNMNSIKCGMLIRLVADKTNLMYNFGYRNPADEGHFLVQTSYINNIHGKLFLRLVPFHQCWFDACREVGINRVSILFKPNSRAQIGYGENILGKMPEMYPDLYWFKYEGFNYVTFSVPMEKVV